MAAVVLLGSGHGGAQSMEPEVPLPETSDARTGDRPTSIAGIKRELETVKSLRTLGSDPKGEAPRLGIPQMETPSTPTPPVPRQNNLEQGRPSPNWLLDAMEKSTPPKSARGVDPRFARSNAVDQRKDRNERPPSQFEREGKERGGPANPFSQYLGDWISPQDYALLKPALGPSGSVQEVRANAPKPVLPGEDVSVRRDADANLHVGFKPLGARVSLLNVERVNPYLDAVKIPTVVLLPGAGAEKPKALATTLPKAEGINSKSENPAVTPPAKPPDIVRPSSDEKYFKQLRRF